MTGEKPRRPKGSGSIYTRKDGRIVGEYEANGKKRYVYGKTKKDVAAKLAKAIADRDAGRSKSAGAHELQTRFWGSQSAQPAGGFR